MKNTVRHMIEPSAHARFRMIRVVTERLRARARMLHMMKRFPGTPRMKTMARMKAPMANETVSGLWDSRVVLKLVLFSTVEGEGKVHLV